ncbi:MAG: hypothetical protein IJ192_15550 [Clostridia bacterium]|nr:hypothetical protein [Clostridia bacterium]MBQ8135791.1 hypothetical protein [Clostridia bacterium]
MKYFTDQQLSEMRSRVKNDLSEQDRSLYLAYLTKIEILDKRNDEFGDCREELLQAIAGLEKVTEGYVHRGRSDPNDEDADAFEYENYDFRQTTD